MLTTRPNKKKYYQILMPTEGGFLMKSISWENLENDVSRGHK